MNKSTYIYSLEYPKGNIRYIGKSNTPKKRFNDHLSAALKRDSITRSSNWLFSLLINGERPILNIVDEIPMKEWEFWETYYISLYKSWGFVLTNLTNGGDGVSYHNKENRDKISKGVKEAYDSGRLVPWNKGTVGLTVGRKGHKKSKEEIENIKKGLEKHYKTHDVWNKGVPSGHTPWNKDKKGVMPEPWNKGKKGVQEAWNKGKSMSEYSKLKCSLNSTHKTEVIQFSLSGKYVNEFALIKDANKAVSVKSGIGNCCIGKSRSAGGYLWLYKSDYDKNKELIFDRVKEYENKNKNMSRGVKGLSPSSKKVNQLNPITNEILNTFDSIIEAKLATGTSGVGDVCRGEIKTSNSFGWEYATAI